MVNVSFRLNNKNLTHQNLPGVVLGFSKRVFKPKVYLGAESKASVLWSGLYEPGANNLIQLLNACGCGSANLLYTWGGAWLFEIGFQAEGVLRGVCESVDAFFRAVSSRGRIVGGLADLGFETKGVLGSGFNRLLRTIRAGGYGVKRNCGQPK